MQRLFSALLVVGLLLVAAPAMAVTGVAFVHGTGNQTDALNDYWTSEMVNSVRQGLPDQSKYVVINCQFEEYMWTSAAAGASERRVSATLICARPASTVRSTRAADAPARSACGT